MKKIFLIFMILLCFPGYSQEIIFNPSYDKLRIEIVIYNLINELYLEKEQMELLQRKQKK